MALIFRKVFRSEKISWQGFSLKSYSTTITKERIPETGGWGGGEDLLNLGYPHYFCVDLKLS